MRRRGGGEGSGLASTLVSVAREHAHRAVTNAVVIREEEEDEEEEEEVHQRRLQEEVERYVQLVLDLYLRGWAREVNPAQTMDREVENDLRRALTKMADACRQRERERYTLPTNPTSNAALDCQ